MISLLIQDGGKISPSVDCRNKGKNYNVQVFKTMRDVHGWVGPFDIVFTAHCYGIFVPAGVVFYRFQVSATEWSKCYVV